MVAWFALMKWQLVPSGMGLRSKQHVFKATLKSFHFQVKTESIAHSISFHSVSIIKKIPGKLHSYTCQHALHGPFTRCERISMFGTC